VYAISAAYWAEYQTYQTSSTPQYNQKALLNVPVDSNMRQPPALSTIQPTSVETTFSVVLTSSNPTVLPLTGALDPTFVVPAPYFYALGARYPAQISALQRFQSAVTATRDQLYSSLQSLINSGDLTEPQIPLTDGAAGFTANVSIAQAAKRLAALSANFVQGTFPEIYIQGLLPTESTSPIGDLVGLWLKDPSPTEDAELTSFWDGMFPQPDYLMLVLFTLSYSTQPFPGQIDLINAILGLSDPGTGLPIVSQASDLTIITNVQWQTLFSNTSLLPPWTLPGSTAQRTVAFLTFARKLFAIGFDGGQAIPATVNPVVPSQLGDILLLFINNFPTTPGNTGNPFSFATALEPTVIPDIDRTIAFIFAPDIFAQNWLRDAIGTVATLYQMTNITITPPLDPTLQFSYMEALYSRGFTTAESVMILSTSQFESALAGTVAYGQALTIYTQVQTLPYTPIHPIPEPGSPFQPVNPGSLVNCVPPKYLSPLGPVQYLSDLLAATPSPPITLGSLVDARRGPVAALSVTGENLDIQLPVIDLVLESLENLGSTLGSIGAVYDVDLNAARQLLRPRDTFKDVERLLEAVPQFSSPSLNSSSSAIYTTLNSTFTSPVLPYNQPLDVCRSYLRELGTNRYETMRHMRNKITELASLDATTLSAEPADFLNYQWRLPVRFEIALEYLCISMDEYADFFSGNFPVNQVSTLYGFINDGTDSWLGTIAKLSGILKATGLSYCEFRELIASGAIHLVSDGKKHGFWIRSLPECPPCCLDIIVIHFPGTGTHQILLNLMIFIRFWRKLQHRCSQTSMDTLVDIGLSLGMFNGSVVNPDFAGQLASLVMLVNMFGLPWGHDPKSTVPGYTRTKLLALWAGKGTAEYDWAVSALIDAVTEHAEKKYHCKHRHAEFRKILHDNLGTLSMLAGFSSTIPWNAKPTCTIRFVEVLTKIYCSNFTVGELVFLFTVQHHLDGDDPFPLPDLQVSTDTPLDFPVDDRLGLWELRHKLLKVEVCDDEIEKIDWQHIEQSLEKLLGLHHNTPATNLLTIIGEHFFPAELERSGHPVSLGQRRWVRALPPTSTTPQLWSSDPSWPFHYDQNLKPSNSDLPGALWVKIPVKDDDVIRKLRDSRQFNNQECSAIQDLYFAPRATLAPYSFLFENFHEAVYYLVQEHDDEKRFRYFQRNIAVFEKRCVVIAKHLTEHVCSLYKCPGCEDERHSGESLWH
jgi:hypothetical protein